MTSHLTESLCCCLTAWVSFRQLTAVEPGIWGLRWNLHLIDLFDYFESKEIYGNLYSPDWWSVKKRSAEQISAWGRTSFTCQQLTTFSSSSKLSWDVSSFSPFLPELTCHCLADPCNTETTSQLDLSKMYRCNTATLKKFRLNMIRCFSY